MVYPPNVVIMWDRRDRIRHEGAILLWRQIADDLRADIVAGRLPSGSRLPTYLDLAEGYGVADKTIRRALLELRDEGLIEIVVGRGIYVA